MAQVSKINLAGLKPGLRIDAEFYQADYQLLESELLTFRCKRIKHFAKVTDGEHGSVQLRNSGIKYLTAENVKNGFIDISKVRYVDEIVDRRNKRASVRVGDVLMSIKGTLGEVAMAEEWLLPANMNRDVAIIKPLEGVDIMSEYLTIFLMSKFGCFQAKREGSGGVQQMITLGRLREFLIPILPSDAQSEISRLYRKSLLLKSQADALYKQGEKLLEQELGLDKMVFEKPNNYKALFSEAISFLRFDSEYFQPKFRKIIQLIKSYKSGYENLLTNISAVKPSYDLKDHPTKTIHYIELSNINPTLGYIDNVTKMNISQAPSRAKRIVISGDVIASSVVGSVDKAGLVSNNEEGFIASNGFFQFRSNFYTPEFLLILIKSTIVKEQFQQQSTGGILSAVPDSNLRHIIIPKIDTTIQDNITQLVKEAYEKIDQSKNYLLQAKAEVEKSIEKVSS